jgi:Ser/Thr protein kinase RdoA (MazF antagonist)
MTGHSEPHADVVQRDRALPGLRMLFDPAGMAELLEARSGVAVCSIEPLYIRYKHRTNCLVSYRVHGSMGCSYVYAKALRRSACDKLDKVLTPPAVATWLGPGPVVMRDAAVAVWAHPNDGKLRTLHHVADNEGRGILLRHAPGDMGDAASTAFRTLSYRPERRFVAELQPRAHAVPRAVLKMYTASGYEQAIARTAGVVSRDVLRVPARLARDRRRRLLFLEWLPGRLAADFVSSENPQLGQMALVGEALAELHNEPVNPSMVPSAAYDIATLANVIVDVESLFPRLEASLARLRASLSAVSPAFGHPVTPIHGDLHLQQVLLSPSTVGFVDFDRAGAGPAVGDIACCRAHLERDVLSGILSGQRADDVMEELLSGYARIRQRPLSPALDIYTAAALALLLPEPFRRFRTDAFDLTARILDRALALLTRAESRTAAS